MFLDSATCGIIRAMSGKLSIVLIENQMQTAVAVGRVIGQHLTGYSLYVSTTIAEVVAEPQPADVVLLGLALLDGAIDDRLSSLRLAYPFTRLILLLDEQEGEPDALLQALSAGANDYALTSPAGLLALGRRLAGLQLPETPPDWPAESPPANALDVIHQSALHLAATWNTRPALDRLLQQMAAVLDVSSGYIASWHKNRGRGTVEACFARTNPHPPAPGPTQGTILQITTRPALRRAVQRQQLQILHAGDPGLTEAEHQDMQRQGVIARLIVPLVVAGNTSGWVELQANRQGQQFSPSQIRLLEILASQAAVALEHLLHTQETQQALEETEALYQVASALATSQDAQTIISTVVQEYLRALDLRQGSAILFDFETKRGVVRVSVHDDQPAQPAPDGNGLHGGLEGRQIPLKNDPLYERLMRTYLPVVIEDLAAGGLYSSKKGPEDRPGSLGWAGPEALSLLAIPIQIRGDIIGAMVVEATRQKRVFEQWEISLGQVMADQLGIALQNVELYELEYQRRQQAETLREVTFVVSSSLKLHEVLERILDQLRRVVNYDSAAIHLLEGNHRRVIAGRGFPYPEKVIGLTFPAHLDYSEPGSIAIFTRQPVIIDNVQEIEGFKDPHHQHIRSWLGIPLIARDKVIGLISIDRVETSAFHQGHIELAQAFASQVAVALENARLHELEVNQLEQELRIAQEIQETLLPQFVPQIPGLQISGRLLPAQHIGGDFFHFFSLGENRLGVAIGDVSGKGIPAALYMAVAITAIDINVRTRPAPAELLNQLNDSLYNRLRENKMNIGLQVAAFTPLAGNAQNGGSEAQVPAQGAIVTIASAGMVAPIGATVHGCRFLPVSGLPVAALPYPEQNYSDEEFLLDPFTTVIFTSDGVVEARNEAGELFGFERLEAAVNEIIARRDAETIAEHIIHTAQAFIGRAEQNDDMTVVVVVKT